MLAVERQTRLLELLHKQGLVTVAELAPAYHVSEETIRRDLQHLEARELGISRTYGGAYLTRTVTTDVPVNVRENIARERKEAIAAICDELVKDGDTLMLDSSTTALQVATHLKRRKDLTIITNSLSICERLAGSEVKVICAGGTLRHSQFSFVGPATGEALSRFWADKAIVSCVGVGMDAGLTDSDEREAEVRRLMLARARQRILIADYTKLDKTFFSLIAPLDGVDSLVTDQEPNPRWMAGLAARKVVCQFPGHVTALGRERGISQ
jgi:DeoR/GlpR family transcriptional regulator of sugar metabolism